MSNFDHGPYDVRHDGVAFMSSLADTSVTRVSGSRLGKPEPYCSPLLLELDSLKNPIQPATSALKYPTNWSVDPDGSRSKYQPPFQVHVEV